MKQLWCPWRLQYILGPKPDACVFCLSKSTEKDQERFIVHRGKYSFVILNIFPYNNGHLMVAPFRHTMNLNDLSTEESAEIFHLLQISTKVLEERFSPQGINIGLNLGEAAGAGVREHLHFHVVPRWNGDSSFMAIMDEVRVIPEYLQSTYNALAPLFAAHIKI